jgi:hypothetical protein
VEGCEEWFAGARLAFVSFAAIAWDATRCRKHLLLTRVLDKSSRVAVACFEAIMSKWTLSSYTRIVLWTDGPGQFKSSIQMASLASWVWANARGSIVDLDFLFLCPKHGKGECDELLGWSSQAQSRAFHSTRHDTVAEVVSSLRKAAHAAILADPSVPSIEVEEWLPEERKSYKFEKWQLSSMGNVRDSFHFQVRYVDNRRLELKGKGTNFAKWTGCRLYNHSSYGNSGPSDFPISDLLPDSYKLSDEVVDDSVLAMNSKQYLGWRTSFATHDADPSAQRTKHLMKAMGEVQFGRHAQEGTRHRSVADRQHAAAKQKARKVEHARVVSDYDRSMKALLVDG